MCGFIGVFGNTEHINLDEALKEINHRGPDDRSIKKGEDWLVGFNRLSIIDLNKSAMQPFENDSCIVYLNGEIYNYIELINQFKNEFVPKTNSDVEIITYLYKKFGLDFLDKLNGMFSIVLIDKKTKIKYLIRDRFGQKPLYFTKQGHSIIFSSEIKAIKTLMNLIPDRNSVFMNLACWMLPPPLTLYKDVFSLMPGEIFSVDSELIIQKKLWYKLADKVEKKTFSEEEFISIFRDSVEKRTRSDVPVSIFLSGGLDSMMICDFMKKFTKDLTPLTAAIEEKSSWPGEMNTDVINPGRFCEENNLTNKITTFNYEEWDKNIIKIAKNYEEIFIDSGNLVFYRLGALAKKNNIKVVLAGNGGDELFGGYPWQKKVLKINPLFSKNFGLSKNIYNLLENVLMKLDESYVRNKVLRAFQLYLSPSYYHATSLSSTFVPSIVKDKEFSNQKLRELANKYFCSSDYKNIDWGNKVNISNFSTVIPSQNYKADMGAMASSVENRAPFLDYRLVEYMLSVPHKDKVKYGHKSLLRKVSKKYLPSYISNAKKSGPTMPLNRWFSGDKFEYTKNFIIAHKELTSDFLGYDFSNKWFEDELLSNSNDNCLAIFAIINLILWLKINYSNEKIDENCPFSEL